MLKTFLKLSLSVVVYTIVFISANAIMPFSRGVKELGASEDPLNMVFLLITSGWVCFTIYYIIRHAQLNGMKLYITTVLVMFLVQIFMAQIETLFFGDAFPALTALDVILIMTVGLITLSATVALMVKLFRNKNVTVEKKEINIKTGIKKLGIIGLLYPCVYFVFGYFVAWQFEDLRILYSGSPEKLGFFSHLASLNPVIYSFQILRGILFGLFVIPLMKMVKTKKVFVISTCLVYLYLGVVFLTPNALFPGMARIGHLLEMTSSMLVFGIIVGYILWDTGNTISKRTVKNKTLQKIKK